MTASIALELDRAAIARLVMHGYLAPRDYGPTAVRRAAEMALAAALGRAPAPTRHDAHARHAHVRGA